MHDQYQFGNIGAPRKTTQCYFEWIKNLQAKQIEIKIFTLIDFFCGGYQRKKNDNVQVRSNV